MPVDLYSRIRLRREELNMSQEELAQKMGYKDRSAIAKIESGTNDITQSKIKAFADALDTTTAYLMGWDTSATDVIRIPVLGTVPAGIPLEAIEDIQDWEEIPAGMAAGGREYFGLRVKGDSMYPQFLDGDTVIVRKQDSCTSGDICVVYVNGYDATLKQVQLGDDGSITLKPRNPEYPPRTYTASESESLPISIAGVVVELRRKI